MSSLHFDENIPCFQSFCNISGEKMISFLLSNESLCDGPTNGPVGRRTPLLFLFLWFEWNETALFMTFNFLQKIPFHLFYQPRNFSVRSATKGTFVKCFSARSKSAIYQTGNKLENLPQRNIFFSGLGGIEIDRNEIYVFNFPPTNSIQTKIQAD